MPEEVSFTTPDNWAKSLSPLFSTLQSSGDEEAEEENLFKCPKCGSTEGFSVDYWEAYSQGVMGITGDPTTGEYEVTDWGDRESYDGADSQNDRISCECGWELTLGHMVIVTDGDFQKAYKKALSNMVRKALDAVKNSKL